MDAPVLFDKEMIMYGPPVPPHLQHMEAMQPSPVHPQPTFHFSTPLVGGGDSHFHPLHDGSALVTTRLPGGISIYDGPFKP